MNKKKISIIGLIFLSAFLIFYMINANLGSRKLEYNQIDNGIVPDESTAIKLAEVVGLPIFGENMNDYKPFHARLENDSIWHVYGLPKKTWFDIQLGGSPVFKIQKKDGKVLRVYISR